MSWVREKLESSGLRVVILLSVLVVIALTLAVPFRSYLRLSDSNSELAAEVAQREQDLAQVQGELERWQDDEYVQQEARSRLNFVFPGETAYIVTGQGNPLDDQLPPPVAAQSRDGGWYGRLWDSVEQSRG